MAPQLGQLVATVSEKVIGESPTDNIFTSQTLLAMMKENGGFKQVDGGRLIELGVIYQENSTFKSYSDLETLDTTRQDFIDCARYEWKEIGGTTVISELEMARAQGEAAKYDLAAAKAQHAKDSLFAVVNRQMWSDGTGNSSKDIGGLKHIVASSPTTGTVGGINRATFSFWRNYQASCAKTSAAYDNLRGGMRTMYNTISRGGASETPAVFLSGLTIFGAYEGTLTANERFTSKDSGEGGFATEVIKFKGAKVAYDDDCPTADAMWGLNFDFLKFYYPRGRWAKVFPAVTPANQTAEIVKYLVIGNMGCSASRRQGIITGIT
jgi:hypothetical protein